MQIGLRPRLRARPSLVELLVRSGEHRNAPPIARRRPSQLSASSASSPPQLLSPADVPVPSEEHPSDGGELGLGAPESDLRPTTITAASAKAATTSTIGSSETPSYSADQTTAGELLSPTATPLAIASTPTTSARSATSSGSTPHNPCATSPPSSSTSSTTATTSTSNTFVEEASKHPLPTSPTSPTTELAPTPSASRNPPPSSFPTIALPLASSALPPKAKAPSALISPPKMAPVSFENPSSHRRSCCSRLQFPHRSCPAADDTLLTHRY